jgi:hypothetical protein
VFYFTILSVCRTRINYGAKISSAVVDDKYMEGWWNDNDREKLKYLEKNLSQHHFLLKKFRTA